MKRFGMLALALLCAVLSLLLGAAGWRDASTGLFVAAVLLWIGDASLARD